MPVASLTIRKKTYQLFDEQHLPSLMSMGQAFTMPPSPLTTEDALWTYMRDTWGITIPRVAVCDGHSAPFTAFAEAYFARGPIQVWQGSRGFGGKTFLLAALGLALATTLYADVVLLGGSLQQSTNIHNYMHRGWLRHGAPTHLLASDPARTQTRLTLGNTITALTASQRSVRGPHPQKLLCDEADEMDLRLFDAAMGQTMAKGTIPAGTVISSTHQYADGTFTEILKRAAVNNWRVHTWCYRENMAPHGWLAPEEVERKRGEVTATMWATEYEHQEPSPESRAIDPDAVTAMFQRSLGVYDAKPREYIEIEAPEPRAEYAHGADWAKKVDWTELITLRADTTPYRLVAYERMQRLPWPTMVGCFNARISRFAVPPVTTPPRWRATHDGTGLGNVVDDYLEHEAEGMVLAGRARADLFSDCVNAIERKEIVAPFIAALESQVRYCTVDDLYGAGHPPDGFVALALAYRAAKTRPLMKRAGTWGRS